MSTQYNLPFTFILLRRIGIIVGLVVITHATAGEFLMLSEEKLDKLVAEEWKEINARHPFNPKNKSQISWMTRFTPPLPLNWPPVSKGGAVYYGYTTGILSSTGKVLVYDGMHVGKPWIKIEVIDNNTVNKFVLSKEISRLGTQGVRPLTEEEISRRKNSDDGPQTLLNLTKIPGDDGPGAKQIRGYYCFWRQFNGVIARHLAVGHASFFAWLKCG